MKIDMSAPIRVPDLAIILALILSIVFSAWQWSIVRKEIAVIRSAASKNGEITQRLENIGNVTIGSDSRPKLEAEKIGYYTPELFGELHDRNADTVRRWIHEGRIHAKKEGGSWRIPLDARHP